jgi:hypothetical protein
LSLFPFLLGLNKKNRLQRVGVEIDSDIWTDFRAFVRQKHGRIHSTLALEVENALECYMEKEKNSNEKYIENEFNVVINSDIIKTHSHNDDIMKLIAKIKEEYDDGTDICFKHLCQLIIQSTEHFDERTHKKYVNVLIAKGILIKKDILSEKYECYTLNLSKPPPI